MDTRTPRALGSFLAGVALTVSSIWVLAALRADALDPADPSIIPTQPERVLDSRDGNDIGLPGPFLSRVPQKLQITGSIPTATGTKVVVTPGATGVVLNVTPVGATRDGFISVEPGDAVGLPTTSSLNFRAGETNPNAVTVALPRFGPDAGKIRLTYDAYGQVGPFTDILVDVVAFTTAAGVVELSNRVFTLETESHVIPPGTTVTGNFMFDSAVIADNSDNYEHVALPARAPVPLSSAMVNFAADGSTRTTDDDASCTGTFAVPTAPDGKVCIYQIQVGGADQVTGEGAGLFGLLEDTGFLIAWRAAGPPGIDSFVHATWAYTAP